MEKYLDQIVDPTVDTEQFICELQKIENDSDQEEFIDIENISEEELKTSKIKKILFPKCLECRKYRPKRGYESKKSALRVLGRHYKRHHPECHKVFLKTSKLDSNKFF